MSSSHRSNSRYSAFRKVIATLLVICLILAVAVVALFIDNMRLRSKIGHSTSLVSSETSSDEVSSDAEQIIDTKPDIDVWNLRLANKENVLPDDFTTEVSYINSEYTYNNRTDMRFDTRAIDDLHSMLKAAASDGARLTVISCFRTMQDQIGLFDNETKKWQQSGMSEADAKVKASTIVAIPGTSDHNLGLAVDLNSTSESFENTKQFAWLKENAEKYGFVLRYPKNKEDVTEIIYEPWHYRYVGKEHAKVMNELGMCLEEYIDYLKK